MNFKSLSPFDIIRMSPIALNPKYTCSLLSAVLTNILFEIKYAHMGVRRIDRWNKDEFFLKLYHKVKDQTVLNPNKLFELYQFAKSVCNLEGNVAELGVFRGGSARMLAKLFEQYGSSKRVLLFDTFQGLPVSDKNEDIFQQGGISDTSFEGVGRYLKDCSNVLIYKGLFSETLPKIENSFFCFVHIDADLYSSIFECCSFFYSRMVKGGIMLFDDYGLLCTPGAKDAVDKFFSGKIEIPIWLSTGQCIVIKH
ncbi:MAG: hypothetical protein A3B68_09250 [Candidatus Melainabacteria bacterium RIFCSPHIGHO2_02_FULL_34_12]|nr:MAG: hypothetical protein A3B68_09250 [Candidatus Melainabacteria bacterium RIFCSPHIGHO2_02_FULL_34_12]